MERRYPSEVTRAFTGNGSPIFLIPSHGADGVSYVALLGRSFGGTILVKAFLSCLLLTAMACNSGFAANGDPQVGTDHPWYSGELTCSTWERLFANQAEIFKRAKGKEPKTDEEKALASWMWRNYHYWHGEEGVEDLWSEGWNKGGAVETRDYWKGL